MSDEGAAPPPGSEAASAGDVLLLLIAPTTSVMDELITALLDLGITGATIIEAKGLGAMLREEMPIFAGLASLLPERTGCRVVISMTTRGMATRVLDYLQEQFHADDRPLALMTPLERVIRPGVSSRADESGH